MLVMNKSIKYKGYTISQASNNHIMITKDNKMVFHAQCNIKLNAKGLKQHIDWYIKMFVNSNVFFDEFTEELEEGGNNGC